jgi:hypothetical protein
VPVENEPMEEEHKEMEPKEEELEEKPKEIELEEELGEIKPKKEKDFDNIFEITDDDI